MPSAAWTPAPAVWLPLTADGEPVAGEGVDGRLAVVERPDGTSQVTYDGTPLYSFVEDSGEGTVTGNGLSDDFDGEAFTWHVMTPTGPSTSDANSRPPTRTERTRTAAATTPSGD